MVNLGVSLKQNAVAWHRFKSDDSSALKLERCIYYRVIITIEIIAKATLVLTTKYY